MPDTADRHPELPLDPDSPDLAGPGRPGHVQPTAVLLVFLGGLLGTLARYGLSLAAPADPAGWPWGTFVANLVGALALGILLEFLARSGPDDGWRRPARLFGGTGFCGGFTTYSTFAVETDLLVRDHSAGLALLYLAATLLAGLAATMLGIGVATSHCGSRQRRASP